MMSRVSQPVLELLPAEACSVGPSAGLVEGPEGGVVFVFGLATFSFRAGDETGRRLAAVQLAATKIAPAVEVASAFGVSVATLWRWASAASHAGVLGLVRERPGPKGPSKLTGPLVAQIVTLESTGQTLAQIAAAAGVSTATVRVALGRVTGQGEEPARPAGLVRDGAVETVDHDHHDHDDVDGDVARGGELVVLAAPVPRTADRVAARFGNLAEAPVVLTEGAQLPLVGLLLALPAVEMTGLLDVAADTFGAMSNGFYGLRATLLTGVFLALLREPRAEGATRIAPADLGRVLGLDRAPEVKTLRRKLSDLAAHGAGAQLQAALGAHHAATRPDATGFLYLDGHVRVYTGTRELPKTHIARMRIAGPATEETWVTDTDGDPGLLGRGAGDPHPGDVGLGQLAGAGIHAHVSVEVEEPGRVRAGGGVVGAQGGLQLCAGAVGGELSQLAAQGLDLRGPVQPQDPAQVGGGDPGRALRAGLTQQRQEHPRHQGGAQPVEPVAHRPERLGGHVQEPGHLQRGQPQEQSGQSASCKTGSLTLSTTTRAETLRGPVSLLGPFGPGRSRTSPTTPPWETAAVHRHNVATLTPNADATPTADAILVAASCTAARRRPVSSPAA